LGQYLDNSVNTQHSFNRIVDSFVQKFARAYRFLNGRGILSEKDEDFFDKSIDSLKQINHEATHQAYILKGYMAYHGSDINELRRDYSANLLSLRTIVSGMTTRYENFVYALEDSKEKRSAILPNYLTSIRKNKGIYINLSNNLNLVVSNESGGHYSLINANSFEKLLDKHYENKGVVKNFLLELRDKWNLKDDKELGDILGINKTVLNNFLNRNDRFGLELARVVSNKQFRKEDERVIVLFSGSPELGTNEHLIKNFFVSAKNIVDEGVIKEKSLKLLDDLYERNSVVKREIKIDSTDLYEFLNGAKVLPKVIKKMSGTVPFLTPELKQDLALALACVTDKRNADELLKDNLVGRGEFFNILFKQSLMEKHKYATHIGVSEHTLDDMLNGDNISVQTAVKVRGRIGVSEGNSEDFIDMATDKMLSYKERVELFHKIFETPLNIGLRDLCRAIGLTKEKVGTALSYDINQMTILEAKNVIPANKMLAAFKAYHVPDNFHSEFSERFRGPITFVTGPKKSANLEELKQAKTISLRHAYLKTVNYSLGPIEKF